MALASSLAACGGGSSADSNEKAGSYQVRVTGAQFPTKQRLGQTSLLQIGIRNTGKKTVPAIAVTLSIAGKPGQTSSLPFAIHDPQPELAQPDRPVWVLAEGYPKLAGTEGPGGATTSSHKTFDLGALKPGASLEGIWKLSAVKGGQYTLLYGIDAGLSGAAKAETVGGVKPGGSFVVQISETPPESEVTNSGQIVEIGKPGKPNK